MPRSWSPARLVAVTAACVVGAAAVVPAAAATAPTSPVHAASTAVEPASVIPAEPTRIEENLGVSPGLETCLPVAGTELVPSEADGVVVNVTTVRASSDGHVVLFPSGGVPTGSNVNFDPGHDVANAAFVALGDDGAFCYRTAGAGSVGILIDLVGFTVPGQGIELQAPQRLLDTRPESRVGGFDGPVQERTPFAVQVAGVGAVPADAESVILNVTVTGPITEGNLRVFPGGADVPESSVVNFVPLGTRAVATVVRLPDEGTISFYADSPLPRLQSNVHVIIDVVGWTVEGSPYVPLPPARALDTRTGLGLSGLPGQLGTPARVPGRQGLAFRVDGDLTGVPQDAAAVVLNVAAVHPDGPGNLRLHRAGSPVPETSTLNYVPAVATGNLAVVPLPNPDGPMRGLVTLWSDSAGSVDVVADVIGYVSGAVD